MLFSSLRQSIDRAGRRPGRVDEVRAQFENAGDADNYAAAYDGWGTSARYYHSRLHAVEEALHECRGGDLLDIGCGPGMLVRHLLDIRPGAFRITACDQSAAMVQAASTRLANSDARLIVTCIEDMPFPGMSFDVVVAMGVLEYADATRALREISRVVRPDGLILVTMLNPLSPYRLFEWVVYRPGLRLLGRVERWLGVVPGKRHGARSSGVRAIPAARLRRMMRHVGLRPQFTVYYDVTPLVPPLDRIVRRWARQWRTHPERTVTRGTRRWMGTAYLMAVRRTDTEA